MGPSDQRRSGRAACRHRLLRPALCRGQLLTAAGHRRRRYRLPTGLDRPAPALARHPAIDIGHHARSERLGDAQILPADGALAPLSAPRLDVDRDAIEALSADRDALWQRVNEAQFLTVNEKREATGYGRLDDDATL